MKTTVKSVVPWYQLGSCYGRVAACDISLGRRTRIKYKNVAITKRSRPCGAIKNSANELGTSNRQNCARLIFSYIVYFRSQKADILIFFSVLGGADRCFDLRFEKYTFFLYKRWIFFFIRSARTLWIHLTIIHKSLVNVILCSRVERAAPKSGLPIVYS